MNLFQDIAAKIIKEQELVIGPLAWSEARKVQGLTVVDAQSGHVEVQAADAGQVIDRLVAQYERLFGKASHEVCRDAAASLIPALPAAEVPSSLR